MSEKRKSEEFDKRIKAMNEMADAAGLPRLEDRLLKKGKTLEQFKQKFIKHLASDADPNFPEEK